MIWTLVTPIAVDVKGPTRETSFPFASIVSQLIGVPIPYSPKAENVPVSSQVVLSILQVRVESLMSNALKANLGTGMTTLLSWSVTAASNVMTGVVYS